VKHRDALVKYLQKNNYLRPGASVTQSKIREELERYAIFHGLNSTAPNLDELVYEHSKLPRCWMPDLPDPDMQLGQQRNNRSCRWPHKNIRFWHDMKFSNVPDADVQRCWRAAIDSWKKICGILPEDAVSKAASNVFAHAKHIDGASNVLAWSMLPCGQPATGKCEQRYDLEPWPRYGTNFSGLQEVMAHEIGHALGIDHLARGNLMQPMATFNIVVPQPGDIAEAQARYGPSVATPTPTPPTPPGPTDPGAPLPPAAQTTLLGEVTFLAYDGRKRRLVLVDDGLIL
jgi:hypothetical protein